MLDDTAVAGSVTDQHRLRARYGLPTPLSVRKEMHAIDAHARDFIGRSPFVVVSTCAEGGWPEASPRGDTPGFVVVESPRRLLLPDRPGNNRLHSMQNLVADGRIGLLFMVPRIAHTLRVQGAGRILADPATCARFAVHGKPARSVVEVTVELAYFHCGKAVIRSGLWEAARWPSIDGIGSFAKVLSDQIEGVDEADAAAKIEESYTARLY